MSKKVKCQDCCHLSKDGLTFCSTRKLFVNPRKGRFCQDYCPKIAKVPPVEIPIEKVEIKPVVEEKVEAALPKKKSFWQKIFEKIRTIWYNLVKWKK